MSNPTGFPVFAGSPQTSNTSSCIWNAMPKFSPYPRRFSISVSLPPPSSAPEAAHTVNIDAVFSAAISKYVCSVTSFMSLNRNVNSRYCPIAMSEIVLETKPMTSGTPHRASISQEKANKKSPMTIALFSPYLAGLEGFFLRMEFSSIMSS